MPDMHDPQHDDPLCAYCGRTVPPLEAIIYHGVVYHPACVVPTTRRSSDHGAAREGSDRRLNPRQP